MAKTEPEDWTLVQQRDRQELRARLAAHFISGPFVALPAVASLPIMGVAGEGDYIIVVLGLLWAGLAFIAYRFRRTTERGSTRRACTFWVILWSSILAITMIAMAGVLLASGEWRYQAPGMSHGIPNAR